LSGLIPSNQTENQHQRKRKKQNKTKQDILTGTTKLISFYEIH